MPTKIGAGRSDDRDAFTAGARAAFAQAGITGCDFAVKLPDDLATEYDQYIIRAPLSQNLMEFILIIS